MAERIGLTKNVKLEWMEIAANCQLMGKSQDEAYPILNEKIGEIIHSPVNSKQIRVILFNMWYRPEDWFLAASIKAAENLPTDERIGVHWALLLKRYQVFYDLCVVIGGLFNFRDVITLSQIRNRIFEIWGARDTLQNCLAKNIQTFKELKSISATSAPGSYCCNSMKLDNMRIMQLFCAAVIERSGRQYMTWEELIQHPALFPFAVENLTQADMSSCEWLCLERMGDDVIIRIKNEYCTLDSIIE